MFPHKFVLSALTLETSAWAALGLDNRSDGALLLFLTIHAAASLLLAFALFLMLPSRLSKPRLPTIALLFIIGFAVPILGFLAMAGVLGARGQTHAALAYLDQAVTINVEAAFERTCALAHGESIRLRLAAGDYVYVLANDADIAAIQQQAAEHFTG